MKMCVLNRKLCWNYDIGRNVCSLVGCRAVEVAGSVGREKPKKTWE